MKYSISLIAIFFLISLSNLSFGKTTSSRKVYIDNEMKLLNTYLKSIDDELKQKEPQMDSLYMLSDLFLDTAYKIKNTKSDQTFHKNFKSVIDDVKALNKFSKANNYPQALVQARSIKNNCMKCHTMPK